MRAGANRAVQWILFRQRPDGSLTRPEDGIGGYYKVPFLLPLAGRIREAHALLDWIAAHHLTECGDFRAPERRALQAAHTRWSVYANAWIVLGALRVFRWDVARPGVGFIVSRQSPNGAFPSLDGQTEYIEPVNTAWGGLACLAAGSMEEARKAARLLANLAMRQPDRERFYYRMDLSGAIVTSFPADAQRAFFVDTRTERQVTYNPGIALIFLAHMARAEGPGAYRDASAALSGFAGRCNAELLRFPPSGKLGLGCALWYSLTRDREAHRVASEVGAWLLKTQGEDGSWRLPDVEPYASRPGRDDFETRLDLTAEFAVFLLEMAALL